MEMEMGRLKVGARLVVVVGYKTRMVVIHWRHGKRKTRH